MKQLNAQDRTFFDETIVYGDSNDAREVTVAHDDYIYDILTNTIRHI